MSEIHSLSHSQPMMTPTHNKMGFSVDIIDPFTAYFIEKAAASTQPIADLGCGFGVVTRQLLAAGATVIANDLSDANLMETKQRVPAAHQTNLTLRQGDATLLDFAPGSLGGIMAGRWVHFLTTEEAFDSFFRKAYTWLQPGGVLCVTVHVAKDFVGVGSEAHAEYEEKRARGVAWPGWVTKGMMRDELKERLPDVGYAFHPKELRSLLEGVGFCVERCGLYSLAVPPITLDQIALYEDNSLGIVAVKSDTISTSN